MPKSSSEFVDLLLRHQNIVHKICRAYCPLEEDRRDLFQDVALQLWRAYPGFRGEAKESTWIYRIALHVAISRVRRSRAPTDPIVDALHRIPVPEPVLEAPEQLETLYRAIHALSDVDKALVLLYFEDKSVEEIADITGMSANNIRVKMHRIREKLRLHMQKLQPS